MLAFLRQYSVSSTRLPGFKPARGRHLGAEQLDGATELDAELDRHGRRGGGADSSSAASSGGRLLGASNERERKGHKRAER